MFNHNPGIVLWIQFCWWSVTFRLGFTWERNFSAWISASSPPWAECAVKRQEMPSVGHSKASSQGCAGAGRSLMGTGCLHTSCCANRQLWRGRTGQGTLPTSSQDGLWSCKDGVVLAQAGEAWAKDREPQRTLCVYDWCCSSVGETALSNDGFYSFAIGY